MVCVQVCSACILACRGRAAWPYQGTMFPFRVGNDRCLTIGNTIATVNHNEIKD